MRVGGVSDLVSGLRPILLQLKAFHGEVAVSKGRILCTEDDADTRDLIIIT